LNANYRSAMNRVIIIGGGSFQGKSLIALCVAHKFNIPLIISTDTIRNILHILNPHAPYLLTSTYLMSSNDFKRQLSEVSKVLLELLVIVEKRGEDIIIEGMHLSDDFIAHMHSKENAVLLCIDNKQTFEKRIKYKSLTRHRVEYFDPFSKEIKYGDISESNLMFTPYAKNASRISEIHQQILSYFIENQLPIVQFQEIEDAMESIDKIICNFMRCQGIKP